VPDRDLSTVGKVLLALSLVLLGADSALAYVGPGADVAFLSYALTLLAWAGAALSAIFMWPLYALLRKIRSRRSQAKSPAVASTIPASEASCAENNAHR